VLTYVRTRLAARASFGCGLLLALAFGAFCTLFSTWASYDDEGYILWTLIHHAQGHLLYEDIFTQYGPAFYLLDTGFRHLVPLEYSSDGQRWQTWIFWLVTTGLMLGVSQNAARDFRGTTWLRWNSSTILFAFLLLWHQDRLALEPGHPQIWCNLLVSLSLFLFAISPARPHSSAASLSLLFHGLLAGTLLMIKPNVGLLLLAALPASKLWSLPRASRGWLLVDGFYTLPLLILPWLLTYRQLHAWNAVWLPGLVCLSLLALRVSIGTTAPRTPTHTSVRPWHLLWPLAWLALGSLLAIAGFSLWSFQQGVRPGTLVYSLFGQHASLLELYFYPAIRSQSSYAMFGLLIVVAGYYWLQKTRRFADSTNRLSRERRWTSIGCSRWIDWAIQLGPSRAAWSLLLLGLMGCCLWFAFLDSLVPLIHGLQPRGCAEILCVASPAIVAGWWLLRNIPGTVTSRMAEGRLNNGVTISQRTSEVDEPHRSSLIVLALVAALQPLIAFPVPGTQLALGTLPLLALLIDGSRLAWQEMVLVPAWRSAVSRFDQHRGTLQRLVFLLPGLVLAYQTVRFLQASPLDLPGARLLRLPPSQAHSLQQVVEAIRQEQAQTFIFRWHNRPSWYLWSEITPPYHQLPPSWVYLLPYERKLQQWEELQQVSRVLVIDEAYEPQKPLPPSPWNESWAASLETRTMHGEFQLRSWSAQAQPRSVQAPL
jgi:hypothetical protein